ncbi:MAG: fibronectin type III domain-containing protein [bacterium]
MLRLLQEHRVNINWQLKVEDRASRDTGSLNLWKIKVITSQEEWVSYNYLTESPHNYPNNYTNTWVITHLGASKMRVHFESYSLEPYYDKLYILDKNNNQIACYSAYNQTDIWLPVISGDVVKIKLTSDGSIVAYGFKVDKYQAVGGSPPPQDTTPPAGITSLSASEATMNSIKLTWTASGDDGNIGQANSYDIRYATSTINDTNWANATQVQNEPIPAIAGTSQNLTISGLQINTSYYFAIKAIDEVNNTSPLSNIASCKTQAPINIGVGSQTTGSLLSGGYMWYQLYLASQMQVKAILSMTSSVDYDIKVYSGDAFLPGSFITGSYQGIGQTDQCFINTMGYIWIKVYHYSGSGNYTLNLNIEGGDVTLPAQIINLQTTNPQQGSITLTWTAPGDDGNTGTATQYDIRYNTELNWEQATQCQNEPIPTTNPQQGSITLTWTAPGDDGNTGTATQYDIRYNTELNWEQATQCQNEPIPTIAGTQQSFIVTGLQPYTRYLFLMKTRDEVPNWSLLSNIAMGTTTPLSIVVSQVTPSNDGISFTTQSPENLIRCIADIKPDSLDATYNSQIEWEIDDNPGDGINSGNPLDPERGNNVYLTATPTTAPNGRGAPLSYRIRASLTINNATYTSVGTYTRQDERDQIRQEYIDMNKNRTPNRPEFVNAQTYVNPGHFAFNEININQQYTWAIFTIAQHLENIRNVLITVPGSDLMPVNSGYRNPIRNASVPGPALNSWHIYGRAADIANQDWNNDGRVDIADQRKMETFVLAEGGQVEPFNLTRTWVHMNW